jgi:transcription termination/antitermination protein NusG
VASQSMENLDESENEMVEERPEANQESQESNTEESASSEVDAENSPDSTPDVETTSAESEAVPENAVEAETPKAAPTTYVSPESNEHENSEAPDNADTSGSDEGAEESTSLEDIAPAKPRVPPIGDHHWYVVHTYSGYENKAKAALEERIRNLKKEAYFTEIVVPEENVIELVKGKKKTTKRRFFPGYILVKMNLKNDTWHIVKDTPRITGFVGDKNNPLPVPESEVQKMTNRIAEGEVKPRPRISFSEGENVRVVDGPFSNFNGVVEEVNLDKGKVKVLVSIFGRHTPVELDFIQVEKV